MFDKINQDTIIKNQLITGDYKTVGNKFATNYGDSLSIVNTSLFMYKNQLEIKRNDSSDFDLIGLRIYQVSESLSDTLIIEGWTNSNRKYMGIITNNNGWQSYMLFWYSIDKIVFRADLDYNIDNILVVK